MEFKVGDHFHKLIASSMLRRYKCHIVAIVDDVMIVYKWYGKHKQWWHYEVEHKKIIEIYIKQAKEQKYGKNCN